MALLQQTLRSDIKLVPIACSRRWRSSQSAPRKWAKDELLKALEIAITKSTARFCFFVDGLDEYHPQSEQQTLVREMKKLSEHPNVKVVVSSRPWDVFENAFDTSENKLVLESLTSQDIFDYVLQRLLEASIGQIDECLDWNILREQLFSEWD